MDRLVLYNIHRNVQLAPTERMNAFQQVVCEDQAFGEYVALQRRSNGRWIPLDLTDVKVFTCLTDILVCQHLKNFGRQPRPVATNGAHAERALLADGLARTEAGPLQRHHIITIGRDESVLRPDVSVDEFL